MEIVILVLHVLAVIVSSRLHHENLVLSMITGRKRVPAAEGIGTARPVLAAVLLAAVLGFWMLQWQAAPQHAGAAAPVAATDRPRHGHDDD